MLDNPGTVNDVVRYTYSLQERNKVKKLDNTLDSLSWIINDNFGKLQDVRTE